VEVILREDVDKLGRRGEVVKVAEGYGRNFLLPRGLAVPVTTANKAMIERERKAHEARMAKEKAEWQSVADRINSIRHHQGAGEQGRLADQTPPAAMLFRSVGAHRCASHSGIP
jgi:large subunit ribosomal protein L9